MLDCYKQNIEALGFKGLKKIFLFCIFLLFIFYSKTIGANDPHSGAIFDPREMIGMYIKIHIHSLGLNLLKLATLGLGYLVYQLQKPSKYSV